MKESKRTEVVAEAREKVEVDGFVESWQSRQTKEAVGGA